MIPESDSEETLAVTARKQSGQMHLKYSCLQLPKYRDILGDFAGYFWKYFINEKIPKIIDNAKYFLKSHR